MVMGEPCAGLLAVIAGNLQILWGKRSITRWRGGSRRSPRPALEVSHVAPQSVRAHARALRTERAPTRETGLACPTRPRSASCSSTGASARGVIASRAFVPRRSRHSYTDNLVGRIE